MHRYRGTAALREAVTSPGLPATLSRMERGKHANHVTRLTTPHRPAWARRERDACIVSFRRLTSADPAP
ncbi:MAG: hypothetical protein ACREP0_13515 [Rhodanobacteraceae bacterium]